MQVLKNVHIWGPSLLGDWLTKKKENYSGIKHIIFCIADHYEPKWNSVSPDVQRARIQRWIEGYPKLALLHRDSNGRPPQHSLFYAAEEYEAEYLEELSKLCAQGYGEIELHLHHDKDTAAGFRGKLEKAKMEFSQHGALITKDNPCKYAFGFIHGNWALNNSRGGKYCGLDHELKILKDAGCYADFTLPSAPAESQTRQINSIYYARDIEGKRKSHDRGVPVKAGGREVGDLMLIQGPLALNWRNRKYGILPRIENGSLHASYPGTPDRVDLWVRQHIHVKDRPEWVFVKVHCHGTQEQDTDVLLGNNAHMMYSYLEQTYNDGKNYMLHYVTAREMYNIIKAAESCKDGDPFQYKDYLIKPYLNSE